MMKKYILLLIISYLSVFLTVHAKPSTDLIKEFVQAFESARKPDTTTADIEHYFSFMADDVSDYHAAYDVIIDGKDRPRISMMTKAKERTSYQVNIEEIALGSSSAVLILFEDSNYYKDGKLKHFQATTLYLLEFNEQDLIQNMWRYPHQ